MTLARMSTSSVRLALDCAKALHHDPRFFTTSVAVQDLDRVREALGYQRLNLYGISYGTRVVQHYLRRFPEHVRSAVLDGVLPPSASARPGRGRSTARPRSRRCSTVVGRMLLATLPTRNWQRTSTPCTTACAANRSR